MMPPMATAMTAATATDSAARRFAVACGVLSQYVKASGAAQLGAAAQEPGSPAADGGAQQLTIFYGGRVVVLDGCTPARATDLIRFAAAASQGAPLVRAPAPKLVVMPIARKASLQRFLSKRKDRSAAAGPPYGRREEEEAAAALQGAPLVRAPAPTLVVMPIARKASLQRFLSKRKDRSAAAGPPYGRREEEEAARPPPPAKKGKTEASSWLALGSLGDMHAK